MMTAKRQPATVLTSQACNLQEEAGAHDCGLDSILEELPAACSRRLRKRGRCQQAEGQHRKPCACHAEAFDLSALWMRCNRDDRGKVNGREGRNLRFMISSLVSPRQCPRGCQERAKTEEGALAGATCRHVLHHLGRTSLEVERAGIKRSL